MAAPGLLNLRTDLKSLRYGSDKPYVTKDINNPPSSNQTGMQITKRIDDLSRISQMLIDRPGLKFIGNQALLQQVYIQDKLQKNRDNGNTTLGGAIVRQALDTVKQTAKIVGSTLAQVPVNGTGTHFVYAFRTDTYLKPSGDNNRTAFAQFFGAGGVEGAPLALRGKQIDGQVTTQFLDTRENISSPNGNTPKFNYDAPIKQDGEGGTGTNWNEKPNKPIPIFASSKIKAQNGTTIVEDNLGIEGWKPNTSLGVKEKFVDRDTNQIISQSIFVSKEIQDKQRSATTGSVRNSPIEIISPFTGTPLTIPRKETTAAPKSFGISNQTTPGTVTGRDVIIKPFSQEDQESKKKSKHSTEDNIINALTGSAIPLLTEENGRETTETAGTLGISNQTIDTGSLKAEGAYTTGISDFRSGRSYSFNYNSPTINRERRVNLGNQGKVSFDRSNYSNTDVDTQDTLNKLNESTTRIDGTSDARDLAKLYFEIITPEGSTFLHFRAFIDSIDDNFNADWQGTKYVGRAENFYTYGGFERDINISFKIAAATRAEMKPLYRKMVFLASSTAPTYGGQGFMRGTLARLTVGSYFSQLPGVITSVKYSLIQDMPWEISMQNPEAGTDDDMQELPMGLQCSVSYKVIHDFAPQTGLYHYFTSPNPLNGSTSFLK